MSYADYIRYCDEHPDMERDLEKLRDMLASFATKYRMVLENRAIGRHACDEYDVVQVIVNNRKALHVSDRVPERWYKEDEEEVYA